MINKITHLTLFVNDQDEAMQFYRDKIGMKVHTDMKTENMRWLTMCPATQTDFEIVLMPAVNPEAKALVGKQTPEAPFICVSTDDCVRDVQELEAKGVRVIQQPNQKPWGMDAMFLDLYGNIIYLLQPTAY